MTRKLLAALLALFLCALLPAGCGREAAPETDDTLQDTFEALLAADYEVYYLFFSDGMTVDTDQRNGDYFLVTAPYDSMDALTRQLQRIYAKDEMVRAILGTQNPEGVSLILSRGDKLWQAISRNLQAVRYEVQEGSIRIGNRDENAITFLFRETGLDGSLYETEMTMTRTSAGWRLTGPRWEAERTLLREGSDIQSAIPTDAARQSAAAFLNALLDGDTAELSRLTRNQGTGAWDRVKITEAAVTETVEELDSRGDYRVMVTVEEGGGVFPEGRQEFRLVTESSDWQYHIDEVIPVYFRPSAEEYYNWRDYTLPVTEADKAAQRVESFIDLYGWVTFGSPWELPAGTVAEYALCYAEAADGGALYTPAEFAAAVERTFGITGFDGRGTSFYDKTQDRYLLWGRGPDQHRMLISPGRITGTRCQVDVTFYSDTLCTVPQRSLRYTLEKGPEGDWRLQSAQLLEE